MFFKDKEAIKVKKKNAIMEQWKRYFEKTIRKKN